LTGVDNPIGLAKAQLEGCIYLHPTTHENAQ
jgi:hypothetical protein